MKKIFKIVGISLVVVFSIAAVTYPIRGIMQVVYGNDTLNVSHSADTTKFYTNNSRFKFNKPIYVNNTLLGSLQYAKTLDSSLIWTSLTGGGIYLANTTGMLGIGTGNYEDIISSYISGGNYESGNYTSIEVGSDLDFKYYGATGSLSVGLDLSGFRYDGSADTTLFTDNSLPTYRMLKNAVKSPLTDGIWKSNGSTFAAYANSASAPSNSFFTEFSGNLAYKGDFESEAYFCRGGSGNFTYLFAGGLMVTWGGQDVMALYPTMWNEVNQIAYKLGTQNTLTASGMKLLSVENGGVKKYTVDLDGQPEVETAGKGIILKSPDGTRYKVSVPNGGATLTITVL